MRLNIFTKFVLIKFFTDISELIQPIGLKFEIMKGFLKHYIST